MTIYDFEAGSIGNAATPANTGASSLTATGGSMTIVASLVSGSKAVQCSVANTTNSITMDYSAEAGIGTTQSIYITVKLPPEGYASDTTIWQGYQANDTTTVARLTVTTAGILRWSDNSSHNLTIVADITSKYGSSISVRVQMNSGTTTSDGSATIRYYATPVTAVGSPTATVSTSGTWNLGAGANFGKQRLGINTAQATVNSGHVTVFDYYVVEAGSSWIASPAAAVAPTANAGSDQHGETGTTFTLSGSGTIGTGGGSIDGYLWALESKSNPALATPSIATPTAATTTVTGMEPGVYTFKLVVHQTGGALSSTSTADATNTAVAWVHPSSGVSVKPKTVTKDVGITREGSASTDEAAISDTDSSTGMLWPDAPSGEVLTIVWNPCGPSNPRLSIDLVKTGTGTVSAIINTYMEDGTTLLDGPYPVTVTSVLTSFPAGLSAGALTALGVGLTNRHALVTKVTGST